ncbi:Zn(II)2Cys6 transcription factor [Phanerochaete sordida]|uniref:Zn(II)2Cys6 transcription factor n=1 Tax=Phanerochaete sordida TaxID=48140 RepID=A0A9P3GBP6_9APHY|nr:Zn(II)2Cys6 transcription factor [Phanerochaete sordida]
MVTQLASHDWPSGGRPVPSVNPWCKYGFHEKPACCYASANEPDSTPVKQNNMSNEEIPGHLPRGRACQACRNRKMKCDGNQPVCNQCVRFKRENECIFVPGPAPSNSRMLEQEIRRLENQIRELELRNGRLQLPEALNSPSLFPANWWEAAEPPRNVGQTLAQVFLLHASKFGFFLDVHRFVASFVGSVGTGSRIPALLRNTIYLWGVHIIPGQGVHEDIFLRRALQCLPQALSANDDIMHAIQAEILLAYYFFECNRLLEGQQHVSGALSLARSCKLHKFGPGPHAPNAALPPALDSTEEQMRVNAWWQLFALEKAWTTALDTPSLITERRADSVIDTPWPRDQQGNQSAYGQTVQKFLANVRSDRTNDPLAFYAKASVLYEQAAYAASLLGHTAAGADVNNMVVGLDASIEYFKKIIPVLGQPDAASAAVRHDLLVIHTLAQCATIALHKSSAGRSMTSLLRCITAANTIVNIFNAVPLEGLAPVNPIIAFTAFAAHEVIVSTFIMVRGNPTAAAGLPNEGVLLFGMGVLKGLFSFFAGTGVRSPLFEHHLSKVCAAQQPIFG